MSHDRRCTSDGMRRGYRRMLTTASTLLPSVARGLPTRPTKIHRTAVAGITAVLLLGCGTVTQATPISFAFQAAAASNVPVFGIVAGEIAHGTYTFDSSTRPATSGNPAFYTNAVTSLTVQLAGVGTAQSTGPGTIIVGDPETFVGSNPGTADYYAVNGVPVSGFSVNGSLGTWSIVGVFLSFEDRTDTALSSLTLPLTPPNPANYAAEHSILLNFESSTGSTSAAEFTVTSLTLVPEPSTLALAVLAAIGVGLGHRLRKG
jgi:hypothetical protein